ncbi:MAG: PAS domain-containing protein [Gemmatimonadaceae bacterium]
MTGDVSEIGDGAYAPPDGSRTEAARLFAGPGEMRERCRELDWATTPLGPVEGWPQSLRTISATVLASAFANIVLWGPDLIQIYNDSYIPILGTKHPWALGMPTRVCWPEAWEFNSPIYASVFAGETVSFQDQLYRLLRNGPDAPPDDVYITLSYSPITGDTGEVGGVLVTLVDTTERITAQRLESERDDLVRKLEVESARLEGIFRQAPTFFAVLSGPNHVFELANDAYFQVVGYRDIIGKPLLEALPDLDGQGFTELLDEVLATGEPFVGQEISAVVTRSADALPEQRFVDFVYQAITDSAGNRTGVVTHGSDVTEHVRARQALEAANAQLAEQQLELELTNQQLQDNTVELEQQSEELQATAAQLEERTEAAEHAELAAEAARDAAETGRARLAAMLDAAPAVMGVYSGPEHVITYVNPTWDLVVGKPGALGRPIRDVFPEMIPSGIFEQLDRVYETGEPWTVDEIPLPIQRRPDGPIEDSVWNFVWQPLPGAYPVGPSGFGGDIVVTAIDITEQVRAREIVREREIRILANAIPTLAWTARPDGYIDWYNARWYEYTGTTLEEMQGWGWQSLHDPVLLPGIVEDWTRSIASGELFERMFPLRRADGEYRWFLTRAVPVRDAEENILRWFGINTDITSEREAADALMRANAEVEARASEAERAATRTRALQSLTAALSAALTPADVVAAFLERGRASVGAKTGVIMLLDPDRLALNIIGGAGYPEGFLDRFHALPVEGSYTVNGVINEGVPQWVHSRDEAVRRFPPMAEIYDQAGLAASAAIPLCSGEGKVRGALVFNFATPQAFGDEERDFIEALAG